MLISVAVLQAAASIAKVRTTALWKPFRWSLARAAAPVRNLMKAAAEATSASNPNSEKGLSVMTALFALNCRLHIDFIWMCLTS